jgi:hypothetical protein
MKTFTYDEALELAAVGTGGESAHVSLFTVSRILTTLPVAQRPEWLLERYHRCARSRRKVNLSRPEIMEIVELLTDKSGDSLVVAVMSYAAAAERGTKPPLGLSGMAWQ